jgi:hypothetical protein
MTGIETAGEIASILTAGATTATLGVLIWYTIETYKLRKEAQKQNESAVLPIVVIEEPSQDDPEAFVIRNIGKGPAFQISALADSERCRSAFRGDGDHDSDLMPITIPS